MMSPDWSGGGGTGVESADWSGGGGTGVESADWAGCGVRSSLIIVRFSLQNIITESICDRQVRP